MPTVIVRSMLHKVLTVEAFASATQYNAMQQTVDDRLSDA